MNLTELVPIPIVAPTKRFNRLTTRELHIRDGPSPTEARGLIADIAEILRDKFGP